MMAETIFDYIGAMILGDLTGNEVFDTFMQVLLSFLYIAVVVISLALIFVHRPIRKRQRTEDRLMFTGCVMIIIDIVLYIFRSDFLIFISDNAIQCH